MDFYPKELRDKKIKVFDTTLRDGEQTPGVSLNLEEKIKIAKQLDKLGVDIIEAGFPISSKGEKESVKKIALSGLNTTICGLARVVKADIDACIDSKVDLVHIFIPTSDIQIEHTVKKSKEEIYNIAIESTEYVKSHGLKCMFSAMDATRTELNYLIKIYKGVQEAGCDIINVPDTVGVMVPSAMYNLIKNINSEIKIPIDVHCHNDFGLAVANSLAAVEAGASQVQVAVNGLGERGGNANLAETIMSLHAIYGAKTNINTKYLVETSRLVERYTGVHIPPTMPIVGDNAFAHESGIHSHGVLESSETFEPGIMTPEMVGHRRRIVLGKHAGKHAVEKSLKESGLHPTKEQLYEILNRIKELGDKGKQVTDVDMYAIAEAVIGSINEKQKVIDLKEVSVMTGNIITPTAAVKAMVKGKECVVARTGVGPVDAAMNAVLQIIDGPMTVKLRDFKIEAISGGSDAIAEVIVGVEDRKGNIVTGRAAREDIVMASVEALVSAINMLLMQKGVKS
ncbi:MAG: 2-isopropylmalate synthase [Methanosarcinales archaeon]